MTPEREAQMREMFEAWAKVHANYLSLKKGNCGWYISPRAFDMFEGFLACARALEPMVRDAERYQWLRSDDIEVLPGQREINVYMERLPHTEEPTVLLITTELDDAIDAAMSAALEDENATE